MERKAAAKGAPMTTSLKSTDKKSKKGDGTKSTATFTEFKKVDWKDPKLLAEMGVAALIIVVFMALSNGFIALS